MQSLGRQLTWGQRAGGAGPNPLAPPPPVGSPRRFFPCSWEDGIVFCSIWHHLRYLVIPHPLLLPYTTAWTAPQAVGLTLQSLHRRCDRAKNINFCHQILNRLCNLEQAASFPGADGSNRSCGVTRGLPLCPLLPSSLHAEERGFPLAVPPYG